jgi:hypothetical protein
MPLKRTHFWFVLSLLGGATACSGNPLAVSEGARDADVLGANSPPVNDGTHDAGVPATVLTGSVDLSQAPTSLEMSCNRDVGSLAFKMPCEIGESLLSDRLKLGANEVDCHVTASGQPLVWTFILAFYNVLQHPDRPVTFPNGVQGQSNQSIDFIPPPPGLTRPIDIGGEQFWVSGAAGTISFSRIDSSGRAFSGQLKGRFDWTSATGSTFSCEVDGPFWGGPGNFL